MPCNYAHIHRIKLGVQLLYLCIMYEELVSVYCCLGVMYEEVVSVYSCLMHSQCEELVSVCCCRLLGMKSWYLYIVVLHIHSMKSFFSES